MLPCTKSCCCRKAGVSLQAPRNVFSKPYAFPGSVYRPQTHTNAIHGIQQQQQWHQHLPGVLLQSRLQVVAAAAAGKGFGTTKSKGGSKTSSKGRRKCPCGSGQAYEACCARYHLGSALAPNPEALLRSRFSAYALQEVDYLVKTTHIQNPERTGDTKSYARSLKKTAAAVEYIQLDISGPVDQQDLPQAYWNKMTSNNSSSNTDSEAAAAAAAAAASADGGDEDAFLKFSVKWRPREGGPQQLANEISHFRKVDGVWLYFNEVDLARTPCSVTWKKWHLVTRAHCEPGCAS